MTRIYRKLLVQVSPKGGSIARNFPNDADLSCPRSPYLVTSHANRLLRRPVRGLAAMRKLEIRHAVRLSLAASRLLLLRRAYC